MNQKYWRVDSLTPVVFGYLTITPTSNRSQMQASNESLYFHRGKASSYKMISLEDGAPTLAGPTSYYRDNPRVVDLPKLKRKGTLSPTCAACVGWHSEGPVHRFRALGRLGLLNHACRLGNSLGLPHILSSRLVIFWVSKLFTWPNCGKKGLTFLSSL